MPQFQIDGADPNTGEQRIVILNAVDARDAVSEAQKLGLIVRGVQPFTGEYSPPQDESGAGVGNRRPAPLGISYHNRKWLSEITTPMLVSGVANILASLIWAPTCIGFLFAIALTSVAVCEFRLLGESRRMPADLLVSKARRIAYYEIVVGLLNGVSIACGIVLLMNCERYRVNGGEQKVADGTPVQKAHRFYDSVADKVKGFRKKRHGV